MQNRADATSSTNALPQRPSPCSEVSFPLREVSRSLCAEELSTFQSAPDSAHLSTLASPPIASIPPGIQPLRTSSLAASPSLLSPSLTWFVDSRRASLKSKRRKLTSFPYGDATLRPPVAQLQQQQPYEDRTCGAAHDEDTSGDGTQMQREPQKRAHSISNFPLPGVSTLLARPRQGSSRMDALTRELGHRHPPGFTQLARHCCMGRAPVDDRSHVVERSHRELGDQMVQPRRSPRSITSESEPRSAQYPFQYQQKPRFGSGYGSPATSVASDPKRRSYPGSQDEFGGSSPCVAATLPVHPLRRKTSASSTSSCEDDSLMRHPQHQQPLPNKNSRYLREIDRRVILSRIAQGEKQSALAKEFQVSRAAICNLNKHRDEVMSRKDENPLAKHPKKPRVRVAAHAKTKAPMMMTNQTTPVAIVGDESRVYEIKSRSVAILLTMVRSRNSSLAELRRYADRLMRLVIEDALSLAPMKKLDVYISAQTKVDGFRSDHTPCAVAIHPSGIPMLDAFRSMEPKQPTGYICSSDSHSQLPRDLQHHNVFLFDVAIRACAGDVLVEAVALLVRQGAIQSMISIVTLSIAASAIASLHAKFPHVKVITVHIGAPPSTIGSSITGRMEGAGDEEHLQRYEDQWSRRSEMLLERFEKIYAPSPPAPRALPQAAEDKAKGT